MYFIFIRPLSRGAPSFAQFYREKGGISRTSWVSSAYCGYVPIADFQSPECCPFRFDDHPGQPCRIMTKARPGPVLGPRRQAARNRIAVNVPQLLNPFFFAPHIEVVIPAAARTESSGFLSMPFATFTASAMHRSRQRRMLRLAYEQMNVFRHQNISGNHKTITQAHCFNLALQDAVRLDRAKQRLTTITTERYGD